MTSHLVVGSLITKVLYKVISYNYFCFQISSFACFGVDVLYPQVFAREPPSNHHLSQLSHQRIFTQICSASLKVFLNLLYACFCSTWPWLTVLLHWEQMYNHKRECRLILLSLSTSIIGYSGSMQWTRLNTLAVTTVKPYLCPNDKTRMFQGT